MARESHEEHLCVICSDIICKQKCISINYQIAFIKMYSKQRYIRCKKNSFNKMCLPQISLNTFLLDPEVHPQNEEYWGHVNPIGPRACYDEGKRVAETMCYAYMKQVPSMYHY